MVNRRKKFDRLMRLFLLMQQSAPRNAADLARELGASKRTIHRDLSTLTEMGVPWFFDDEAQGYRIRSDFFLPPLNLTSSETFALLSLAQAVAQREQVPLLGPAARAVEKIRGQLPREIMQELCALDGQIDYQLPATGPAGEAIRDVFEQVRHAIRQRRALSCQYESLNPETDGETAFLFRPYAVAFDQRAWYTVGHHDGHDEIRRLKLNRFVALTPTDRPYAIPDDFSLDAYRGNAWRMIPGGQTYHIVIGFDPEVAETVSDTNWHPTQDIEDHKDGSITFICDVDGLDEIIWWILGYGPHAIVHEPKELVDRVAELVKATAKRYAPP